MRLEPLGLVEMASLYAVCPLAGGSGMNQSRSGPARTLAPLPIIILVLVFGVLKALGVRISITLPPLLLPVLTTVFIFVISGIAAYLAVRAFLMHGNWRFLLLGTGLAFYAASVGLASWLATLVGQNAAVTLHNSGSFLASAFFFYAAMMIARGTATQRNTGRGLILLLSCGIALGVALALVLMSL